MSILLVKLTFLLSFLLLTFCLAFPLIYCKFKLLKQEDCKRKARVCPLTLPVPLVLSGLVYEDFH